MTNLLDARRKAGFEKRGEAAEKLGVKLDRLRKIENGQRRASVALLLKMAEAYGVPFEELARGYSEPQAV